MSDNIRARALSLCERLSLDPRSRDCGPSNPMSHRSPIKTCTRPRCDCGPSGELEEIEAWLREQDTDRDALKAKLAEAEASAMHNLALYAERDGLCKMLDSNCAALRSRVEKLEAALRRIGHPDGAMLNAASAQRMARAALTDKEPTA